MKTSDLNKVPRWVWIVLGVVVLVIVCCCGGAIGAATQAGGSPQPSETIIATPTTPHTTTPQATTPVPTTEAPVVEPTVNPVVVDLCAPYLEKSYDFADSDDMTGQPTITKVGVPNMTGLYAINATWVRPALTAQFDCRVWQGNLQYARYSTQDRRVDLITGHTI